MTPTMKPHAPAATGLPVREFEKTPDPVARQVSALTPAELADWLVKYHGAKPESVNTIARALASQFKWHRLQGRLDMRPWLAVLAELLGLRQDVRELGDDHVPPELR